MPTIAQRPGHPVGCADPSCSWGALLLTPCFLALPLAFLPLLLSDLLVLQALLRLLPPLVLRFMRILLPLVLLGSLISLRWVRSTNLVILDPRAELQRLRMLKEYELGGDVLQGDQFAPLA